MTKKEKLNLKEIKVCVKCGREVKGDSRECVSCGCSVIKKIIVEK